MIELDGPQVVFGKKDYETVDEPIIEIMTPLVTDEDGWPIRAGDNSISTYSHESSWDADIKKLVMASKDDLSQSGHGNNFGASASFHTGKVGDDSFA